MKILVIGGGIFGASIGCELSFAGFDVTMIEKENEIMQKASKVNHNRLHLGYHYLRSKETAQQSLEGLLSFLFYYGKAVYSEFPNFYAIAKAGSKTNTEEFVHFCNAVGIDYDFELPENHLLNKNAVESSFRVPEPIFDFNTLIGVLKERIHKSKLNCRLNAACTDLKYRDGIFTATINGNLHAYDCVINASYASINEFNAHLNLPLMPLKYQDVIIPVFQFDHEAIGLTIMDGPFCSVMPNGFEKNQFLLYHVKHSVLREDFKKDKPNWESVSDIDFDKIYESSKEFYPFIDDVKRLSVNRTIRTINENVNDARVSELFEYKDLPFYFSVLSGKITTAFQTALILKNKLQRKNTIKNKII